MPAAGARQRKRLRERLERPDLQAVYGVPHIHGQVDSLEGLGVVEVVDRDGCRGRASGDQTFAQDAQTPSKRLPGVILGKVRVEELPLIIVLDRERDGLFVASEVADTVAARVVEQHAFTERTSVVRPVGDASVAGQLLAVYG